MNSTGKIHSMECSNHWFVKFENDYRHNPSYYKLTQDQYKNMNNMLQEKTLTHDSLENWFSKKDNAEDLVIINNSVISYKKIDNVHGMKHVHEMKHEVLNDELKLIYQIQCASPASEVIDSIIRGNSGVNARAGI